MLAEFFSHFELAREMSIFLFELSKKLQIVSKIAGLKIQISPSTKAILDGFGLFVMKERGEIEVKGKGKIRTYWLMGEKDDGLVENETEEDPPAAPAVPPLAATTTAAATPITK